MAKDQHRDPQFPLAAGEKIVISDLDLPAPSTDEDLNRRYVKGDVRIVTESARYSLAGILSMLQEKVPTEDSDEGVLRYKLDPEYQRRHRWDDVRKSRLIESFLMNVPVPPVFLYETELARYEVMDGRQRLSALSDFYANRFALTGMQYWAALDGRTYGTLPTKVRDGIDRRYISSIILLKETASDPEQAAFLKKMVFERLNSGGVRLSAQETRNAVYDGPLNQLCLRLSSDERFRSMWGLPGDAVIAEAAEDDADETVQPTDVGRRLFERMEDVELVLRFFAYRQIRSFPAGLNKINAFLDRFLQEGNKFSAGVLQFYSTLFEATVSFLFAAFGANAFTKLNLSSRPTKIVYDPLMYVASQHSQEPSRSKLIHGREVLFDELKRLYASEEDLFAGRRTNSSDVEARNQSMAEAFDRAVLRLS